MQMTYLLVGNLWKQVGESFFFNFCLNRIYYFCLNEGTMMHKSFPIAKIAKRTGQYIFSLYSAVLDVQDTFVTPHFFSMT